MLVIGRDKVAAFMKASAPNRRRVQAWLEAVSLARWRHTMDVAGQYPTADFVAGNRVVFDLGGNNARIVVRVDYGRGLVEVRFIGTHAAYDRIDARTI